jgi:hypothetical protein
VSSACYVYAIVGRGTPLPAAGTGGGAELAMVPCRKLAALTGQMREERPPLTIEAVLHHEAVVEAVRQRGPALPVRFGTVFRDATSVASAIAEQYEPLAADLDRLGARVELSLTTLWTVPPPEIASPASRQEDAAAAGHRAGSRYLHARAAELRREEALKERARAVARELDEVLSGLSLERRASVLPTPRIAVRSVYLLDPGGVSAFRAAVETIRANRAELRVLLTGPWPPYSFVGRTGPTDGRASHSAFGELVEQISTTMRLG